MSRSFWIVMDEEAARRLIAEGKKLHPDSLAHALAASFEHFLNERQKEHKS